MLKWNRPFSMKEQPSFLAYFVHWLYSCMAHDTTAHALRNPVQCTFLWLAIWHANLAIRLSICNA